MYDLSESAGTHYARYLKKYELLTIEANPNLELTQWPARKFAQGSFEELFGDLASNMAHSDGNAVAKALERVDGRKHEERENPEGAKLQTNIKLERVYKLDPHLTLADARRVIWDQCLKGKSDTEARKVFAALRMAKEDWLLQAASLFTFAQRNSKSIRTEPEEKLWQVDINQLNHLFLKAFENRYKNALNF